MNFVVSFSFLFSCPSHNFTVLVHSPGSHNVVFRRSEHPFSDNKLSRQTQLETGEDIGLTESRYWTRFCQKQLLATVENMLKRAAGVNQNKVADNELKDTVTKKHCYKKTMKDTVTKKSVLCLSYLKISI